MEKTTAIFDEKQEKISLCSTGRYLVCLNEKKVKVMELEQVGMSDNGEPTYQDKEVAKYQYDTYWLEANKDGALASAKESTTEEIAAYDKSSKVNGFVVNGTERWLESEERRSISYSTKILKEKGEENVDIWFGEDKITTTCDKAIKMLDDVEVYAKKTNSVTRQHIVDVMSLGKVEDVLTYDITADYPEKLNIVL